MGLELYWLYITTFLDILATSLLIPFLPVHLRTYGLPRLVVGVITSVYPSVQLFSSPAVGFYSDRYGQKSSLIASFLLCSLAYYLLASTTSVVVIFFCRVLLGVVKHTQTICKATFLSHNEIFPKSVGFGGLNAAEALGFMLGPTIGAHFIVRENGFRCLCNITTVLFVVNAILTYLFLPAQKNVTNCSTVKSEQMVISKKSSFGCFIYFWDIIVLKLLLCFSLSLFYINHHVLVVEYLKMSSSMVGYTNSFQGLICIITSLFSNKISDLYFLKRYYLKLSLCFLLLSCSLYCINFVSDAGTFMVYLIPLSCSSSLLRIYLTEALTNYSGSNNKASLIGIENTVATIANLMSPFAFEFFSYVSGISTVTYLAFLVSGFGSILSLIFSVRPSNEKVYLKQ